MLLQTSIALMLAIAIHYISRNLNDEAIRIVAIVMSCFCIFLSLVLAPWIVNLLVLIALLALPLTSCSTSQCSTGYTLRR
jgi:hypothetical protein